MTNVTICLTYFRSLTLANLEAALHSVRRQDMTNVNSIVVIDNNTRDDWRLITSMVEGMDFRVRTYTSSFKHGDSSRTHAWSTNVAVDRAETSWIFFTRADYILEVGALDRFIRVVQSKPEKWEGFVTSGGKHLSVDVGMVNGTNWRTAERFPSHLPGTLIDYTEVDTGVWMLPKATFRAVEGLDERLTAWGHAQTHFQYKLHQKGVEFVVIPDVLFYHPLHAAPRDLDLAHKQIAEIGVNLQEMWQRHPGVY